MSFQDTPLNSLIEPAPLERAGKRELPVLSMTMHEGLVDQAAKFKKRVASSDTAGYKVVRRNQLVVGFPIDEGVVSFQDLYDKAIVSPAYDIWNLRTNHEVEPAYLERFLRSPRALAFYRTKLRGTTARRRTLPDDIFLKLGVPLPPLPEQRRIAEILDNADALRAKRRAALAQLDTLAESIFLDMFGDSRDEECALGQHAIRVTKGTTPTTLGYSFADSGIPLLRVQNLRGDHIDFAEDVLYVSEETHRALSRSQIRPGDVLTTIAGTIGRTVVVPANAPDANCNQAVAIITPRESLNSVYLCYWLRSRDALQQMSRGQVTATISNLSLSQIKSLRIRVPSIVEQRGFAARVEAVDRAKAAHQSALTEVNALFASLEHRSFRRQL
jgi:type I restriction enzyme S subunit